MHLPSGRAAFSSNTSAGHEHAHAARLVYALLGLAGTLGLALFVGLTFSTSSAPAAFPGTTGLIACSGPLGPNPPPTGGSFLEIFTMNDSGEINPTTGAPTSQVRLQNNTTSDFNPRFSADGTQIAFVKDNNVWKMNANGTNEVQLTTGGTDSFVGGWSPDASKIVFQRSNPATATTPANFEVFTVNAEGTGLPATRTLTNVSNNPGSETVGSSDSQPSWSPDGTRIAFQSNRLGSPDIWVMNADGTGARPLTASSYAEESAPEFSPDGQRIAFQSDRGMIPRTTGRNLEIYRMNAADGSNVMRLTFNDFNPAGSGGQTVSNLSGFDLNPHWSPAGDRIVFHSGRGIEFNAAQWDAFTLNAVTGERSATANPGGEDVRRLTRRDLNDERCGWSVGTPHRLLSVVKAGTGEGTVTATGIDCGLDCAQGYAPNSTVTLTAAPAAGTGSTFTGFTGGGCSGSSTTCTVTVDTAKTVTATFADANPRLTVTKAGSGARKAGTGAGTVTSLPPGIACGTDCTDEFAASSSVTLFANPATDSTFDGFTGGGCSGGGSTCTVTMDQAKNVEAIFSGPLLTVRKAGTGVGTVTAGPPPNTPTAVAGPFLGINCGTDCSEDYEKGTQVVLTATVSTSNVAGATGSTFAGFSGGGCSGTATTCTVTMSEARNVTATFVDFPTLTVNKTGEGSGTVTSATGGLACGATCSRDFPKDSSVTLTAVPADGSEFNGFTGCATTPTDDSCTVTVDQARAVVARFGVTPLPSPPPLPPPPPPTGDAPPPPPPLGLTPRGIGSLSARVTPGRDLRAPYVFRTSGRLTRPAGVSAADGCSGRVSVQIKGGRSGGVTISTRRVTLSPTCTYSLRVSFGNTRRFGTATRLKVTARFLGNAKMLPDTATVRYVRVRP